MTDMEDEYEIIVETTSRFDEIGEIYKHGMVRDGTVPSGWRFVALDEPSKSGIPATHFEVAMMLEIVRLRKQIVKLKKRLEECL